MGIPVEETNGISINPAKAGAYRWKMTEDIAYKQVKTERPVVDLEANAINRVINLRIPWPLRSLRLTSKREVHTVEQLKTFVVPHKKGKKTIFYKGDMIPKSLSNDFGSQAFVQRIEEPIPDLDDMP